MRTILTVVLMLMVVSIGISTTHRVPQDFATIQQAIDAAVNGDTILVDHGTYHENIRFRGKKIVIASLFIFDNDTSHISKTIVNGSTPVYADSASVVTFDTGTDSNSVLCGFTITGGKGNKRFDPAQNITFTLGGGIDLYGSGGKIIHNHIVDNTLTGGYCGTAGINAWDIYTTNENSKFLVIESNIIARNHINGYYAEGGACSLGMSGRLIGNRIIDNSALGDNNAIGGGLSIWGNANIKMINNIIARNRTSHQAGAMYIYTMSGRIPSVMLVNNTICFNSAGQGSEGIAGGVTLRMLNNIVWNPGDGPDIAGMGTTGYQYNIIRGGYYDVNNYDVDPLFSDSIEYRLLPSSPAISRGVRSAVLNSTSVTSPSVDINGNLRPMTEGTYPDCGAWESETSQQVVIGPQQEHISRTILSRNVRVYLPKSHAGQNSRYPLLIFLHGSGGTGSSAATYGLNELAEKYQFIIASPKSLLSGWDDASELEFLDGLLDILKIDYPIDTNAVFVGGYSSGGFMSYRYGLNTKKRIRGIASVAGLLQSNDNGVRPSGNIALAVFHSTGDAVVAYAGRTGYLSVEQSIQKWMSYYQWEQSFDTLLLSDLFPQNANTVQKISSKNKAVVFYKITGGSHAWPGPYNTSHRPTIPDINASEEIMNYFHSLTVTDVVEYSHNQIPNQFVLLQNYPNPFNPSTTIRYALPNNAKVRLAIYDLLGREIATLVDEEQTVGWREVEWNASAFSSGIYFYRIQAGTFSEVKKMMLIK
jgi:poly(3-hydroxybutyrate) depolymerase